MVADLQARLSLQASQFTTTAAQVERQTESMQRKLEDSSAATTKLSGGLQTAAAAAGGFIAAWATTKILGVLSQTASAIVDNAMAMQQITNTFRVGTGSVAAAGREFGFVRAEAQRLGLDLLSSATSYAKLTAAARGTALEGQATRDIFTALASASTVLGLSGDNTARMFRAFEQMISKGTVSSEELRLQLGDLLPGAMQLAARSLGVTTEKLSDMLQKGEVIAGDFLPRFAAEMNKTFGVEAVAAAGQLRSAFNRVSTAFFDLTASIGDSISGPLTGFLNWTADALKGLKTFGLTMQVTAASYLAAANDILGLFSSDARGRAETYRHVIAQLNLDIAGVGTSTTALTTQTKAQTKAYVDEDKVLKELGKKLDLIEEGFATAAKAEKAYAKEFEYVLEGVPWLKHIDKLIDDIEMSYYATADAERAYAKEFNASLPEEAEILKMLGDRLDRIEMGFTSAAEAERRYASEFNATLPPLTEQTRRHVDLLREIGQEHRRGAIEAQLAATTELQAKTKALAEINGAEQARVVAQTQFEQQKAQASGDYFDFVKAGFAEQATTIPTVWQGIKNIVVGATHAMTAGVSDFLFNVITGTATAGEAFAQFGKAMLRTITDFLAEQAVKTFLSFLFSGGGTAVGKAGGGIIGDGNGLASAVTRIGGAPTDVIPSLLSKGEGVLSSDAMQKLFKGDLSGVADLVASTGGSVSQWAQNVMTNYAMGGGGTAGVQAALVGMNPSDLNAAVAAAYGAEFATANLGVEGSAGLLTSGGLTTGASTLTATNAALLGAGLALSFALNDNSTPQGQASNAAAVASTTGAAVAMAAGLTTTAATGVGALVALPLVAGMLFGKGGIWGGRGPRLDMHLEAALSSGQLAWLEPAIRGVVAATSQHSQAAIADALGTDLAGARAAVWGPTSAFNEALWTKFNVTELGRMRSDPANAGGGVYGFPAEYNLQEWTRVMFEAARLDLPSFGEGGIVTEPTLAMIGERGPEAVVPLDQMGGGGVTLVVKVMLHSREIGEAAIEDIGAQIRSGRKLEWGSAIQAVNRS